MDEAIWVQNSNATWAADVKFVCYVATLKLPAAAYRYRQPSGQS